ncbi:MFS transporter [Paenibacillus koleovorans]|uniref:MFS transporter n=1 Tax=Paenibacillus koleovorans TaxID=121608 RepID=UPI000FDB3A86|nr:MFS transporter [Paenibacillus koleovorans]
MFSPANKPFVPALAKNAKLSLLVHGIFQLGSSLSGVFLSLYLWRLTESFRISCMYQIVFFAMAPFGFALGGMLAKKYGVLSVYRMGIGGTVLFFLAVILAQERMLDYVYGFAWFQAVAQSFYLTGYLTLMFDVSDDSNRVRYLSLNYMTITSVNLVGPAAAGWIITEIGGLEGYRMIFLLGFALFTVAAGLSFLFKLRPNRRKTFYAGHMAAVIRKNRPFAKSLWSFFIFSLLAGIMMFLPQLLLYAVLGQEDLVGYYTMGFALVGVLSSLTMSRYGNSVSMRTYILAGSFIFLLGASLLFGGLSNWSVLVFLCCYTVGNALQGSALNAHYYKLINGLPLRGELRIEAIVAREPLVNLGRIVAIGAMLVFAEDMHARLFPLVLVLVSAMQFASVWFVKSSKAE